MDDMIEKIRNSSARTVGKVDSKLINQAEKDLDFKFGSEYRAFIQNFGILVQGSDEVFGLGIKGYMNVVNATLEERELHGNSLDEHVVIQDYGTGDILITLDEQDRVYESRDNQNKKIYNSFYEFLQKEVM